MPKDLTQLQTYLNKISTQDLHEIARQRQSTKRLEGGPHIDGVKAAIGQIKVGYSIPAELRSNKDVTFGAPTYHKAQFAEVKDLIQANFLKDELIERVQRDIKSDIEKTIKKKIDWRNKAFNCRSHSIQQRMNDFNA